LFITLIISVVTEFRRELWWAMGG